FIIIFFQLLLFYQCVAHVTFTNLKCSLTNETYGEITLCHIKAVNRTHKYVSVKVKLNIIMDNIFVMRYDYGYKPFFIDISIDICKFLKNPQNAFMNVFYNTFRETSNINHTCPYTVSKIINLIELIQNIKINSIFELQNDIIVDKVWTGNLEDDFSKFLPIPNGDYAIFVTFYKINVELAKVVIYLRK
ncbi:hypothetical protein KR044_000957, partial [Drosophila immigrans]